MLRVVRAGVTARPRLWHSNRIGSAAIQTLYCPFSTDAANGVVATVAPSPSKAPPDFQSVVPAVAHFHALYDHYAVPVGFRVPKQPASEQHETDTTLAQQNPSWPANLRGYALGHKLKSLLTNPKHRHANARVLEQLGAIGFPVQVDWRAYLWENGLLKSLQVFKQLHGDVVVPRNFQVPEGDLTWPRTTWGLRLGLKVMNFRQDRYNLLPHEANNLQELGFVWNVRGHMWSDQIVLALQTYKNEYGHCTVQRQFVVPAASPWPRQLWSLRLGDVVAGMRSSKSSYATHVMGDKELLDDLGFTWDVSDKKWNSLMLPAMETYTLVYGKGSHPHVDFIVPAEAPWPPQTWGIPLGARVHNIRYQRISRVHVEQDALRLKELGWLEFLTEKWGIAEHEDQDSVNE